MVSKANRLSLLIFGVKSIEFCKSIGIVTPTFKINRRKVPIQENTTPEDESFSSGAKTPEIRLMTRAKAGVTVDADMFIYDRIAAMKYTPSSKYNGLKYNYGGYIPFDETKVKKKKVEVFDGEDYLEYLRTRACDFVLELLTDTDEDARLMEQARQDEIGRQTAEMAKQKELEEETARIDHRRKLTQYSKGTWNTGTLAHMAEIQDNGFERLEGFTPKSDTEPSASNINVQKLPDEYNQVNNPFSPLNDKTNVDSAGLIMEPDNSAAKQSPSATEYLNPEPHSITARPEDMQNEPIPNVNDHRSTETEEAITENALLRPPTERQLKKSHNSLAIPTAQQYLETIWLSLKMPLDQKMDMAIKFGSYKFKDKLELGIVLWEYAAELILEREALLKECEEFEMLASDPEYV